MKKENSPKKSKYKNKETMADGIVFDSEAEARYYLKLQMLKLSGLIEDFELQPKFELQPSFKTPESQTIRAITYTADFLVTLSSGVQEIIDVKGMETQQGIMRIKMFKYHYPHYKIRILTELPKKYGGGKGYFVELDELKKIRKEAAKNGETPKKDGKTGTRKKKGGLR
jgi:hypothetical protein